jgi:exosortase J
MSTATALPDSASRLQRLTAPLLLLGLALIFGSRLLWIAQLWLAGSIYSVSALAPCISLALIYLKRRRIRPTNPSPFGLLMVSAAILVTLFLDLTQIRIYSATPLLLILALSGVLVVGWGWNTLRDLLAPLLFLLFLVPIPPALLAQLDYPLQAMCARVASASAHLLGIHTHTAGAMILFADPSLSVDIAPACNGVRSTLALLLTAILYIYLTRGPWPRKLALVALAIPLAYAANFARLLGVVTFVARAGPRFLPYEPAFDHLLGLLLFAGAVLLLLLCARLLQCHHLRAIG